MMKKVLQACFSQKITPLSDLIEKDKIVVFTKSSCIHCKHAKHILGNQLKIDEKDVKYVDLEKDQHLSMELAKLTDITTVPLIGTLDSLITGIKKGEVQNILDDCGINYSEN